MAKTKKDKKNREQLSNDFPLNTMSLKKYFKSNALIPHKKGVRINKNGYPYLPCISKNLPEKRNAVVIFFTKAAAKLVEKGDKITDFSKLMQMCEVELSSEKGTFAWKFCPKGESGYDPDFDYDTL